MIIKQAALTTSVLFILLSAGGCNQLSPKTAVPEVYILKSDKGVIIKNDVVSVNGKPFSGFVFELYITQDDTLSLSGYRDGLLHGNSRKWYPDGQLQEERYFLHGAKNGKQVAYWENGKKKFEFNAVDDAYEGELSEWGVSGELLHLANYTNGQECGAQKMWYESGKVRANYVIANGRRYGLLGTKNCKNVSDSIFTVN